MPKNSFILASQSPRRRQILAKILKDFECLPADVEEVTLDSASATVAHNALLKARHVAKLHPDAWVLGSDTVVSLEDQILGKPQNLNEAKQMLKKLSNRSHEVFTAVSLVNLEEGIEDSWIETSTVFMRNLDDACIEKYFSLVDPLDKAGSYNIEEHGDLIIERYDGEFENIMGLPQKSLLKKFIKYSIKTTE